MPKVTLEEKRLEQLRRQLSGKESPRSSERSRGSDKTRVEKLYSLDQRNIRPELSYSPGTSHTGETDSLYLRKDLLKIFFLSGLAIAVEVFLYFGSKSHFLNLSF